MKFGAEEGGQESKGIVKGSEEEKREREIGLTSIDGGPQLMKSSNLWFF